MLGAKLFLVFLVAFIAIVQLSQSANVPVDTNAAEEPKGRKYL